MSMDPRSGSTTEDLVPSANAWTDLIILCLGVAGGVEFRLARVLLSSGDD
jgi:hypothetical protein